MLTNNKLVIKYNHKEEEVEEVNTSELQKIKDYLQQSPTKTLTLNDLEKGNKESSSNTNNTKPGDKTALYIGCGVVGMVLIGLVLILVRRSKNKKH